VVLTESRRNAASSAPLATLEGRRPTAATRVAITLEATCVQQLASPTGSARTRGCGEGVPWHLFVSASRASPVHANEKVPARPCRGALRSMTAAPPECRFSERCCETGSGRSTYRAGRKNGEARPLRPKRNVRFRQKTWPIVICSPRTAGARVHFHPDLRHGLARVTPQKIHQKSC
jgi:hypothetical protein